MHRHPFLDPLLWAQQAHIGFPYKNVPDLPYVFHLLGENARKSEKHSEATGGALRLLLRRAELHRGSVCWGRRLHREEPQTTAWGFWCTC